MTIPFFGWHEDEAPDINPQNLEKDRAETAAWAEAVARAAQEAAEVFAQVHATAAQKNAEEASDPVGSSNTEKVRAEAAEKAEKTRAEAAEASEKSARESAVTAEKTAREAADTTETTRAETAENAEKTRAIAAEATKAPLASPVLTGVPKAPTATALTNSEQLATTAYADTAVGVETSARTTAVSSEATTRGTADTTEKSARESADTTEKTARESADATEKSARETADTNEKNSRETADASEKTRAEAAEATAVKLTGNQTVAGTKTFTSSPIVPTPTLPEHAVTKAYADGIATGLNPKETCQLATTAALPANTYSAGVLKATGNGALSADGSAVSNGQRILVKNEVAEANNGVYVVIAKGGASEKYELKRSTDMETGGQISGAYVLISAGTVNASKGFIVQGEGPFTIGTTPIVWVPFSSATEYTAGEGISIVGNAITALPEKSARETAVTNEANARIAAEALKAPLANPVFTGKPEAPTAALTTSTGQLATTKFVHEEVEPLAPKASPALSGTPTAPTASSVTNNTQIATTAFAKNAASEAKTAAEAASDKAGEANTEKLRAEGVEGTLAPKASPALTGVPKAPTAGPLTSTTQIATTEYADLAVGIEKTRAVIAEGTKAPLASPVFTGTPEAPTAAAATNTAQLATTKFVRTEVAGLAPTANPVFSGVPKTPTAVAGTNTTQIATTEFVHTEVIGLAPLANPKLTGIPEAPTAALSTNTGQLATTKFVHEEVALRAPLASPSFTGTPKTEFTPTAKDNSLKLATTAFVQNAAVEAAAGSIPLTQRAAPEGVATLEENGLVPENQLPLYEVKGEGPGFVATWISEGLVEFKPLPILITKEAVESILKEQTITVQVGGPFTIVGIAPIAPGYIAITKNTKELEWKALGEQIAKWAVERGQAITISANEQAIPSNVYATVPTAGWTVNLGGPSIPTVKGNFTIIQNASNGAIKARGQFTPGSVANSEVTIGAGETFGWIADGEFAWRSTFESRTLAAMERIVKAMPLVRDLDAQVSGLVSQSCAVPGSNTTVISKHLYLVKIPMPYTATIKALAIVVTNGAGAPALEYARCALYNGNSPSFAAGALISLGAPQITQWTKSEISSGSNNRLVNNETENTPRTVPIVGSETTYVYGAILAKGTGTMPTFARAVYAGLATDLNGTLAPSAYRVGEGRESGGATEYSVFPSTLDLTKTKPGNSGAAFTPLWWMGVEA